jgi:hypothetical protein
MMTGRSACELVTYLITTDLALLYNCISSEVHLIVPCYLYTGGHHVEVFLFQHLNNMTTLENRPGWHDIQMNPRPNLMDAELVTSLNILWDELKNRCPHRMNEHLSPTIVASHSCNCDGSR